jgi:cytoskeletal protein RodZ
VTQALGVSFSPINRVRFPRRNWISRAGLKLMATSIGEKLRLARETRGIALRDISEETRISMRYLEAIESDDYRRLPGGICNRSFIRAYAKQIGYDEQQAVEEYTTMMHDRGEETDEASSKPFKSPVYTDDGGNHNRSPLATILLAIIILTALSACVWGAWYLYEHKFRRNRQVSIRSGETISMWNETNELFHQKEGANGTVA